LRTGVGVFSPGDGSRLFGSLLGSGSAQRIAASVDWDVFVPVMTAKAARPIFERMSRQGSVPAAPRDGDFLRIYEATPVNRRPGLLAGRIQEEVARVMGIASAADVDPQRGFFDMGMDSLMAVELRNRLEGLVGRPLHSSVIFNYSNVSALSAHIGAAPVETAAAAAPVPDAVDRELQDISDAEAERLLMRELAAMEGSEIG
jgi:acyl carrier protein